MCTPLGSTAISANALLSQIHIIQTKAQISHGWSVNQRANKKTNEKKKCSMERLLTQSGECWTNFKLFSGQDNTSSEAGQFRYC